LSFNPLKALKRLALLLSVLGSSGGNYQQAKGIKRQAQQDFQGNQKTLRLLFLSLYCSNL